MILMIERPYNSHLQLCQTTNASCLLNLVYYWSFIFKFIEHELLLKNSQQKNMYLEFLNCDLISWSLLMK